MWKDAETNRRARVRQLFEARPSEEHTESGILPFFAWLDKNHRDLLPRGLGDPFEKLKADLKGLYR